MNLTPREKDKLLIFTAALLAERRKNKGIKLNYPESIAYISAEILEGARAGKSVVELMSYGRNLLTEQDVMSGIAEMIPDIQVEATFPDGTKLVTVHNPIQPVTAELSADDGDDFVIPGEVLVDIVNEISLNINRNKVKVKVANNSDRPIQVGSHYHFYETNKALCFERALTKGYRLNIPAGTAVRFEPGQEREIELVEYSGDKKVYGFNGEVMGAL